MMPTHSGTFRRTLLGSTTAKVLNDVDCPVATSRHAETIAPRPMEHREWLCAIGLSEDSERVLRFAMQAATEVGAHLRIIHAIQSTDPSLPVRLDLEEEIQSAEVREAIERVGALQRRVGSNASLRITVGPVKEALIEAIRQSDADTLMIGRIARSGLQGRLRDLTYALVRDSPVPVTSV
jgi:nucleotide-binding universal stress UspA family protein